MKNIEINFSKPYKENADHKVKLTFGAEFDDELSALGFHRELNKLILSYKKAEFQAKEKFNEH